MRIDRMVMAKRRRYPEGLREVSEEHYEALFFGWKIAEGLRNGVAVERLKAYADWFMRVYLKPHLEFERTTVFPILGLNNVRVKRALANHRRLKRLFYADKNIYRSLNRIEDEIGRFVRFEERVIFKQIQEKATPEELNRIKTLHKALGTIEEKWGDEFWKS